jgi:hypothetical protein
VIGVVAQGFKKRRQKIAGHTAAANNVCLHKFINWKELITWHSRHSHFHR